MVGRLIEQEEVFQVSIPRLKVFRERSTDNVGGGCDAALVGSRPAEIKVEVIRSDGSGGTRKGSGGTGAPTVPYTVG